MDYVFFDPQIFIGEINLTDDQLTEYYKNNKNKFKSLNKFRIEYFTISSNYFKNKINPKEREIRRYYKKNAEKYVTPPEIKARHILIKIVQDAPEKLVLEKQEQIKKLLEKIKAGESFEEIAKKYSEDGTSERGGDLGWFKPGEMVPSFEDAAFALDIGQVSEITRTPFGLHLIKVDEIKDKITKSLEEVRDEIITILTDRRAQKKLAEETERLTGIEPNSFLAEAKKFNKDVIKTNWFDSFSVIPKIGSASTLAKELLIKKSGEVGIWKRNPIMGYVIYRLHDSKKPEIKSFEESKKEVFDKVSMEKAELIAIETAKIYLSKLEEGSTIDKLIEKDRLKIETVELTANSRFIPEIGNNKEFIKIALKLSNTNKYGLSISDKRAHLIYFKNKEINNENSENLKKELRTQLLQNMQQALISKELKRLRDSAKIEVINPMFLSQGSS